MWWCVKKSYRWPSAKHYELEESAPCVIYQPEVGESKTRSPPRESALGRAGATGKIKSSRRGQHPLPGVGTADTRLGAPGPAQVSRARGKCGTSLLSSSLQQKGHLCFKIVNQTKHLIAYSMSFFLIVVLKKHVT